MSQKPLVLIVEDDPASRLLATATLEGQGFHVAATGSAENAIELIARQAPDLILMDIQLPGMDGLELTRKLKADPATAHIAVVALTAHTLPLHQRAAMAAGCAGYIAKPVSPAVLSAQVRTYMERRRPPLSVKAGERSIGRDAE